MGDAEEKRVHFTIDFDEDGLIVDVKPPAGLEIIVDKTITMEQAHAERQRYKTTVVTFVHKDIGSVCCGYDSTGRYICWC